MYLYIYDIHAYKYTCQKLHTCSVTITVIMYTQIDGRTVCLAFEIMCNKTNIRILAAFIMCV